MIIKKILRIYQLFFTRFPFSNKLFFPAEIAKMSHNYGFRSAENQALRIAVQVPPDPFFYLLFVGFITEIKRQKTNVEVDIIITKYLSSAFGFGLLACVRRLPLVVWCANRRWINIWRLAGAKVGYLSATLFDARFFLSDFRVAINLWQEFQRLRDEEKPLMTVGGVKIGDLVVDSYLRFRPSPFFNAKDIFNILIFRTVIRDVRTAENYFRRVRPAIYLSSYASYTEHGVAVRVALRNGVRVITFGDIARIFHEPSVDRPFHMITYSNFSKILSTQNLTDRQLVEAESALTRKLDGIYDISSPYIKEQDSSQAEIDSDTDLSGSIIIFLHDFYDNYNACPGLIFTDFMHWFVFTVEALQGANKKFFVRPHPLQSSESARVLGVLKKQFPELKWLPTGVQIKTLAASGVSLGVTAYGSVAHELAFLGVPSISTGEHPHISFEFCLTPKTISDYKKYLTAEMPLLDYNQKQKLKRQACEYYYLRNLYGSESEIRHRRTYQSFWRECNLIRSSDTAILESFRAFVGDPEFPRLVNSVILGQKLQ